MVVTPIPIDGLKLVSFAVDGPLYGIFLCMFVVCGYDLVRRAHRKEARLSWPMVLAGGLLLLLATIRYALNAIYVAVAFLSHDTPLSRQDYFHDVTNSMFQARHAIFVVVQLVLDSFVNYRCWVVWQKNHWIIALPVLLSFVSTGCGFFKVWSFSGLPDQSPASQVAWIKAFLSLSLIANALATSLLAFRIWFTDRNTHNAITGHTFSFLPIARIVLESGMMNAAYLFAEMMVITFDPTATEFMCDLGPAVAGIIFFVVILRVSHRRPDNSVYAISTWKVSDHPDSARKQAQVEASSSIADEVSLENHR